MLRNSKENLHRTLNPIEGMKEISTNIKGRINNE